MSHLDSLNEAQRKAVEHSEGPLLVVAGAGAGKTRVLTQRVMSLIQKGIPGHSILAITFTNKAAKEMKERVVELLNETGEKGRAPHVSTFHSLGVEILKRDGEEIGVTRHFAIFDRSDSLRTVKQAVKKAGYGPKEWNPRTILGAISKNKSQGISFNEKEGEATHSYFDEVLQSVWKHYEKIKKENGALDFDDLLLLPMQLLRDNEEVRKKYHKRWSHIHIDEYQDTNAVQYTLARLLVDPRHNNICVVGDADQTIYSWRGADISNILDFEKDFPGTTTVYLEQNYRSTGVILDAANDIITHNTKRKEKNLFTKEGRGENISVIAALDETDEAREIAREIDTYIKEGVSPEEIAVLYRTNAQSRVLEQALLQHDIPYQILGTRFFDRKEVKDVLSFIRVALNPENALDLGRVINVPPRGIGKKSLERILGGRKDELSSSRQKKVSEFFALLKRIRGKIEEEAPQEVIKYVVRASGMEDAFKEDGEEGEERLQNVRELETLALKYADFDPPEGIEKMLEEAALATDADSLEKDAPAVKLMTIHASKGLEFDVVFITGLEEGLFPQERAESSIDEAEEERRLFYVALTRARKRVILTLAEARTLFGSRGWNMPSRFIGDIRDELLEYGDYEISNDGEFLDLDLL